MARINKRSESDPGEMTRPFRGDVAKQMRDDPLRQVVSLDLIGDRKTLEFRHQSPVPANDSSDEAGVPQMIESALLAIPLTGGIDQRQTARLLDARRVGVFRGKVKGFQCHRDFFGKPNADETAGRDRVAGAYQTNRLPRADDLPALQCPKWYEARLYRRCDCHQYSPVR